MGIKRRKRENAPAVGFSGSISIELNIYDEIPKLHNSSVVKAKCGLHGVSRHFIIS